MKKIYKLLIILCFLLVCSFANATYITTAASISWSGAYASVADGFEATLYNPAGVHMSRSRFGLNILGSYSARYYNNTISTKHVIEFLSKSANRENMSGLFQSILNLMPNTGFQTGIELSMLNFMSYFKFKNFSLGISVLPKTKLNIGLSKNILSSVLDKFDLTQKLSFSGSFSFLQYYDFNGSISTRVKFLEKVIPVSAIYVGIATHIYVPIVFINSVIDEISVDPHSWNNKFGFLGYKMKIKASAKASINKGITSALTSTGVFKSLSSEMDVDKFISNSGTIALGLGFDLGTIVQINKWCRLGLSVTDLGFVAFPENAEFGLSNTFDVTIDPTDSEHGYDSIASFGDSVLNAMKSSLSSSKQSKKISGFMPDTAIRFGVAFTPIINKYFDMIIAGDISVTDLNKPLNGEFPTFNFATGIELLPRINWFEFVFRAAFSYNTEANNPSFSFGTGLHLGAVQMELGVKGLECLFKDIGAKELIVGADFKFVF